MKRARAVHQHHVDVVGHRDLGADQQRVPGREHPQQEDGEGGEPAPDHARLRHADLKVGVRPEHDGQRQRRQRAPDGGRPERDAGAHGRPVEDGDRQPEQAQHHDHAQRDLEPRDRAQRLVDAVADRLPYGRDQHARHRERRRRHQQQRDVADRAREARRLLPRSRDGVQRPLREAEHLGRDVEQGDQADDARGLARVLHGTEHLAQRRVQHLVAGDDLRVVRQLGVDHGQVVEQLERPQHHHQHRDDGEHGEERQRRRQQRQPVHDDAADNQDRDAEHAYRQRPRAAQGGAIARPHRTRGRRHRAMHRRDARDPLQPGHVTDRVEAAA